MRTDYGYAEEGSLGKPYDLHLIKRLYPFSRPYRKWILYSVAIVMCMTLLELSLPYLTKIAIDRYIVPRTPSALMESSGSRDTRARYLEVDMADASVRAVAARYPGLFETDGTATVIAFDHLPSLARQDLVTLRRHDLSGLGMTAAVFLVVVLLNFGLNFVQVLMMEYAGQNMLHELRVRLFAHIQSQPMQFFNRHPVGRLVTRATNDVQNMHELFTSVIVFVFKDLFLLAGIAAVLLAVNWKLALVSFLVLPAVGWSSVYFARQARDAFRLLRVRIAEINTRFSETIGGMKVIQLFMQEQRNSDRFHGLNHDYFRAGMWQVKLFAVFMPVIEVLGSVVLAAIIFYGGGSVLSNRISLGELVAFMSYMKLFFRPIRDISEKYNIMQNAMASAERIFMMFDMKEGESEMTQAPKGLPAPSPVTDILFENVSFGYVKDEPVLKTVSFSVNRGETVAIVGPTGSGKTTLINLMVRFYEPDSGRILINGRDISTMDPSAVRSVMALVTQEPVLFSGTIRQNILKGNCRLSDRKLRQILTASRCDALVDRLPDGVDTVLSESGASVSSGERQLISIARALACDPELIILDEATSYVDSATEQMIQDAMTNLMKHRTAIVVAHRLSTVRHADTIVVLHHGTVVESGTHDELMARKGFYHQLYRVWQKE